MVNEIISGEKKIIEYELADSAGNGILFTDLTESTVILKDYSGNTIAYIKSAGGIVQGSTTTSIQFEIKALDISTFDLGLITSETFIETIDNDFSLNKSIQIRRDELLLKL